MTSCPYDGKVEGNYRQTKEREINRRGGDSVTVEGEIGVMWPHAKGHL